VIDRVDRRLADGIELLECRMLDDEGFVVGAGQDDELGRQRRSQRRNIAGRQQCRQAAFEELADVAVAPDAKQKLRRFRRRAQFMRRHRAAAAIDVG